MRLEPFAGALASVLLTGCITMGGDQLPDITPSASSLSPSIEQTVGVFSFHLDGGKMVTSNKMGRLLNDEILGRWQKSGFIADHKYVKSSQFSEASPYRVTLSGHQEGESNVLMQFISGLTLTTIPYSVKAAMNLHYTLENSNSGCVFEATASDSYNTVIGLLLLPAAPFAQGGRTGTFDRLANNLYDQLATQGAFEPHASCKDVAVQESTTGDRLQPPAQVRPAGMQD